MKAKVLFDDYNWMDEDGAHHTARKGDTVDVSDAEVKRGEGLGGLTRDLDADADAQAALEAAEAEQAAPAPKGRAR